MGESYQCAWCAIHAVCESICTKNRTATIDYLVSQVYNNLYIFFHHNVTNLYQCFAWQTFRPKKKFSPGTLRYSLHKQAQASLSSGINLRSVVQLPEGEDLNDWIAVHGKC